MGGERRERTPAGPDNGPPHRSWGAEGVPLRAIARQQSQQLRNAEIRSMPSDQRIQIIPAGAVAPRTSDRQARSVGSNAGLIVASCRSRRRSWRGRCWRGRRWHRHRVYTQRRECDGRNRCCKCQYSGGEDGPRRGEAFFAQCGRPCGNTAGKQQVSRTWPGAGAQRTPPALASSPGGR